MAPSSPSVKKVLRMRIYKDFLGNYIDVSFEIENFSKNLIFLGMMLGSIEKSVIFPGNYSF